MSKKIKRHNTRASLQRLAHEAGSLVNKINDHIGEPGSLHKLDFANAKLNLDRAEVLIRKAMDDLA